MPTSRLGIGIVGCGFFGRLLGHAIARAAGARLVAVADAAPPVATAAASELGCAAVDGVEDLAARPDVDAIFVATPNHAHLEPVLAALRRGKHAFVEKPMALRAADWERMLDAAAAAGARLLVGHVFRTCPAVLEVRRAIDAGQLGRVAVVRALRTRWSDTSGVPADWWKLDRRQSGGELFHEIHELDLLCWLLGEVDSVFARAANLCHAELVHYEDVVQASLRFASGALAIVEVGTAYRAPEWQVRIGGSRAALVLDLQQATLTTYAGDGVTRTRGLFDDESANASLQAAGRTTGRTYNTGSTPPPRWMEHAVDLEVQSAVAHFRDGAPSPLAEARARSVRVAEAIEASIRQDMPIRLSEQPGLVVA
jgi:predicted dehydrogenase